MSDLDPGAVDYVLTTTRSVRRRLDLSKPIDTATILDCIDVAEQAPTGGNQSSRRWLVIDDPDQKQALADLYRAGVGRFILDGHEKAKGSDHPQAKTVASAAYLVEHLAEVPAIVIPTIIGRHDNSGRPGLFDSVIQSAWSFCLAARARGLGTAWVTAVFADRSAVKDLFAIPEEMTEIVMLPVAHTIGTDFRVADRPPARQITYFNRFGHTFESGPHAPARFADGAGGTVEIEVKAKPSALWPIVTDIAIGDSADTCHVDVFNENRALGWTLANSNPQGTRWRIDLDPIAGGTRLRHSVVIRPGTSESSPNSEAHILSRRVDEHLADMRRVVEAMKDAAESAADTN